MAKIIDIVTGISSIISQRGYDGALDEGNPVKIGLKREQGHPITDKRVMDGFKVRCSGDHLVVLYQAEERLKEIYHKGPESYEQELEQMFSNISNFLVKEYGKLGKGRLRIKEVGPCDALLEKISNYRMYVTANKTYQIQGVDTEHPKSEEQKMFKNGKMI